MTDYIKREDAQKWLQSIRSDCVRHQDMWHYAEALDQIIELLNADVAPVVRCKDCFLYGECKAAEWYGENGNGYCSIGDRRKDDE